MQRPQCGKLTLLRGRGQRGRGPGAGWGTLSAGTGWNHSGLTHGATAAARKVSELLRRDRGSGFSLPSLPSIHRSVPPSLQARKDNQQGAD